MKAAVFVAPGQPLEIRTLPDPEPAPAEMVLAVRASGICGSDLHLNEIADRAGGMTPLPAAASTPRPSLGDGERGFAR
jgi:D-arabinose 1-dehydrogenase-like Zn-dependent alcohol dehydrogenase